MNKYFINTSWMLTERILRMGVSFFVSIYVIRYLGPERYGILSYALSLIVILQAFSSLGLDGVVIRDIVINPKLRDQILGSAFILKVLSGISLVTLVTLFSFHQSLDKTTLYLLIIFSIGSLFDSFLVIELYFQAKVLAKFSAISSSSASFFASILNLLFTSFQMSIGFFAVAVVLEKAAMMLGLIISYHLNGLKIKDWQPNVSASKKLMQDSWPLMLTAFSAVIYMRIDQIMIHKIIGSESVGIYAAAVKISEAFYFLPSIISLSLFPSIIKKKTAATNDSTKKLQYIYNIMTWGSICISMPISILSSYIISTLFGDSFADGASVLQIHIWALVFVSWGTVNRKWFLVENIQLYSFYRTLFGAIVNIILNIIFIPRYGIQGAAFSTVIAWFIVDFVSMLFFKHSRQLFTIILLSFILRKNHTQ